MKNLALLALDECHTIQDLSGFRPEYSFLSNIRRSLGRHVPVCAVSATITLWSASYIHESARMKRETLFVSRSIWRNNINTKLYTIRNTAEIPKTLVFFDNIDLLIDATEYLRSKLLRNINGRPDVIIRAY